MFRIGVNPCCQGQALGELLLRGVSCLSPWISGNTPQTLMIGGLVLHGKQPPRAAPPPDNAHPPISHPPICQEFPPIAGPESKKQFVKGHAVPKLPVDHLSGF